MWDYIVEAMVFPVVMYGCESWTVKKAEHRRTDAFELWCLFTGYKIDIYIKVAALCDICCHFFQSQIFKGKHLMNFYIHMNS